MSSLIKPGEPLDGAAAVRELTGRTSEETAQRKVGVLHWRSFALTIGCGAQGPSEGATTVIEHVTCTACLSAYTHNDYPAAALPTVADVEPIAAAMTADVENDGDRGPRLRDPLASIDSAAQGQHARAMVDLVAAAMGLHVDEVRILVWIARAMPREKLRSACEAATATGWCDTNAEKNPALRTEVDGARAATLAAVRAIEPLIGAARTARRGRDEVLADEAARRMGGGE